MLGLFFSSKLACGFYLVRLSLLLKLEVSASGVTLYLCKSTIRPFQQFPYLGWGRGEGGGGVPSFYYINCKNGYVGLLVLHLLFFLNSWLIVETQPTEDFPINITLVDFDLNLQNWLPLFILVADALIILIAYLIFLSSFLDVIRMSMSTVSFIAQLQSGVFCLQNACL